MPYTHKDTMTNEGPMVIEFNARFGDPGVRGWWNLPRLQGDLVDLMLACATGDVRPVPMSWSPEASVGVVMASRGYPGKYETGILIEGLDDLGRGGGARLSRRNPRIRPPAT